MKPILKTLILFISVTLFAKVSINNNDPFDGEWQYENNEMLFKAHIYTKTFTVDNEIVESYTGYYEMYSKENNNYTLEYTSNNYFSNFGELANDYAFSAGTNDTEGNYYLRGEILDVGDPNEIGKPGIIRMYRLPAENLEDPIQAQWKVTHPHLAPGDYEFTIPTHLILTRVN